MHMENQELNYGFKTFPAILQLVYTADIPTPNVNPNCVSFPPISPEPLRALVHTMENQNEFNRPVITGWVPATSPRYFTANAPKLSHRSVWDHLPVEALSSAYQFFVRYSSGKRKAAVTPETAARIECHRALKGGTPRVTIGRERKSMIEVPVEVQTLRAVEKMEEKAGLPVRDITSRQILRPKGVTHSLMLLASSGHILNYIREQMKEMKSILDEISINEVRRNSKCETKSSGRHGPSEIPVMNLVRELYFKFPRLSGRQILKLKAKVEFHLLEQVGIVQFLQCRIES
ncbi:hypothetical protein AAG570_006869 [Ranatra chinensis]|uniref:Uncharacterized protein n=1 Tax=Ranatra chinensis TaxID=642074 RepID=A0ABD0YVC1_9HEMI